MLRRSSTKKEKPVKEPKVKKVKEPKVKVTKEKKVKAPKPVGVKVKYKTDVYTLMLLFAFLAVLAACVFLYLDLGKYGSNRIPSGAAVLEQINMDRINMDRIDMTRGIYS